MTKTQMLQLRLLVAGWGSLGAALGVTNPLLMTLFGLMCLASFSADIYITMMDQS